MTICLVIFLKDKLIQKKITPILAGNSTTQPIYYITASVVYCSTEILHIASIESDKHNTTNYFVFTDKLIIQHILP